MKSETRKLLAVAVVGILAKNNATGGNTPAQNTPAQNTGAGGDKPAGHARLPIGEKTVNGLKFVATMDEPIKAAGGGEGAFDLVITGYPAGQKPKAVRFWVGNEAGDGSVKAKADEETPDNWHTHAEVPKPLPAGSKFWAEVEPATGAAFKVSFDPKVSQ
jgi:hypothetical protein